MVTSPSITPIRGWDRPTVHQTKFAKKKSNPLIVAGLIAMVILGGSGLMRIAREPPKEPMVQVVVPVKDVPAGARIGFLSVRFFDVPRRYATPDMMTDLNAVSNSVTRTFLVAGEPIRAFMIVPGHQGIARTLENDERALTLQLQDDSLVDHAIQPDDRVDVLSIATRDGKTYTKIIAQAVRVLMSVPKEQLERKSGVAHANLITLAVESGLSELISEANAAGKIKLVLRNRLTRVQSNTPGAEPKDILPASAFEEEKKAQAAAPISIPIPPLPAGELGNGNASIPEPPLAAPIPTPVMEPIEWIVEVFSGAKRENYAVPKR